MLTAVSCVVCLLQLVDVYEDEKYLHLVTELCTGGEVSSDTYNRMM